MTTKKQKNQMLDYLVDRLLNCGKDIVPRTKEMISGIDSNYIKVGDDGIILLVDQVYPNNALNKLYRKAKKERENVGMVLYKDGKTFFRNAAEKNYFKMREDLSLRKYSNDEMHRMISFRPEENFIYDKKERKLQYFQPDSERLPEGLITFEFRPVHFDYEHIDQRF